MTIQQSLRLAGLLLAVVVLLTPAYAVDISYSTTGTFTGCGAGLGLTCSGNTLTGPHGLSITFTGEAADTPNISNVPPPSPAGFGFFKVLGPTTGFTDTVLASFNLSLTQISPLFGSGTETLSSSVSGTIKKSNSQLVVSFSSGSGAAVASLSTDAVRPGVPALTFQLGDVIYWVDKQATLLPQNAFGITGVNGAISSILPEPTFYTLTGSGFVGLLLLAVRRKRQTL
jgi:hypothetical protein